MEQASALRPGGRTVCVVGPESTGKTTLCRALAARFGVPWLPEYAREHLAERSEYRQETVEAIAREQDRRERELLAACRGGVVLDTDLAVIVVWMREKYGGAPAWIDAAWRAAEPRLYLLCRPDLPWQKDPLRESPHDLERLYGVYRRLLTERGLPFAVVEGSGHARTALAVAAARVCLGGL